MVGPVEDSFAVDRERACELSELVLDAARFGGGHQGRCGWKL